MKRLILSVLTIGMVSVTAFAATRAYFSDQATILGNTITTGKVDIVLRGEVADTIHLTNVMPGVWTTPKVLEIYNLADSYPIKYKFQDTYVSQSVGGLYNMINVTVRHTHAGTANPANWPVVYQGKLADLGVLSSQSISEVLGVNTTHVYYFQFQLDSTAGNTFQNQSATFDIVVDAIQQEATW